VVPKAVGEAFARRAPHVTLIELAALGHRKPPLNNIYRV
jgi:hypothetical protein